MKFDSAETVRFPPDGVDVERTTPAPHIRARSILALIVGIPSSAALGALAFLWGAGAADPLHGAGITFGIVMAGTLVWFLWAQRLLSLLRSEEHITARESQPAQQAAPVMHHWDLHVSQRQTLMGSFPGDIEVIRAWAEAALRGQSLSYRIWADRFQGQYAEFREAVTGGDNPLALDRGNHGLKLTQRGRQFCQEILATEPTTLLEPGEPKRLPTSARTHQHTVGGSDA